MLKECTMENVIKVLVESHPRSVLTAFQKKGLTSGYARDVVLSGYGGFQFYDDRIGNCCDERRFVHEVAGLDCH